MFLFSVPLQSYHYSLKPGNKSCWLFLFLHFEVLCHENQRDFMLLSSVSSQSEVTHKKRRHSFSALWKFPAEKHEPLVSPLSIMGCLGLNTHCMSDCSWIDNLVSFQHRASDQHSLQGEGGREMKLYQQRMWLVNFSLNCLIKDVNVCTYNGAIFTEE